MKILVTGASGFLGSALALRLRQDGHDVSLLVRASSSLARLRNVDFETDVCSTDADVRDLVHRIGPQAIVHTACSYGRRQESLLTLTDANVRLGLALLQSLTDSPGPRCLFINTGTALPAHAGAYALSKHQFSAWGRIVAHNHPDRVRFVNVALQHMYGPGDDRTKFTTNVLRACHDNQAELALTAGEQRRDFVYIDDVVNAYVTLLQKADALDPTVDVPVGSGAAPTIREFVQTVHRLCRSKTRLMFGALPYRPGEAMNCLADLSAMTRLGWAPEWTLEAGLERTIALEF